MRSRRKHIEFEAAFTTIDTCDKAVVVKSPPKKNKPLDFNNIEHDVKAKLWCGPAAIAAITGVATSKINTMIRKHRKKPRSHIMGTTLYDLEYVFDALGYEMEIAHLYSSDSRPTFSKWLKSSKKERVKNVAYIVALAHLDDKGGHWVVVMNDMYICSIAGEWRPLTKALFRCWRVDGTFAVRKL